MNFGIILIVAFLISFIAIHLRSKMMEDKKKKEYETYKSNNNIDEYEKKIESMIQAMNTRLNIIFQESDAGSEVESEILDYKERLKKRCDKYLFGWKAEIGTMPSVDALEVIYGRYINNLKQDAGLVTAFIDRKKKLIK